MLQEEPSAWCARNKELVEKAQNGDDKAFCELCRRDPRYLASDFAVFKVLEWKLAAIYANIRTSAPEPGDPPRTEEEKKEHARRRAHSEAASGKRRKAARLRVREAKRNLDRLAASVRYISGRGKKGYVRRRAILADYRMALACARLAKRLLAQGATIAKAAAQADLADAHVRLFTTSKRKTPEGVAIEVVAGSWGVGVERAQRLVSEARKLKPRAG